MISAATLLTLLALGTAALEPDPPIACDACDDWNAPQAPFRIHGNTYWVGPRGLGAVLVAGADGHVLLDGALPQSAPQIARNIEALGFRLEDVKWILNSHAHFDHCGGIAALQRASGARVGASAPGAAALRRGGPPQDDPQYQPRGADAFPAVARVEAIADGATVRVGDVAITAHATPGHTPGATTWTWRSCEQGRCLDVVYADSLTPVSADGFRFSADPARVAAYRASLATVETLPCDVLVTLHPDPNRLERAARRQPADANPFVDPTACRAYANAKRQALEDRLRHEAAP
jgi:metallo-beta-lactamase class B